MLSLFWAIGPVIVGYFLVKDWWDQVYAPAVTRWPDGGED